MVEGENEFLQAVLCLALAHSGVTVPPFPHTHKEIIKGKKNLSNFLYSFIGHPGLSCDSFLSQTHCPLSLPWTNCSFCLEET